MTQLWIVKKFCQNQLGVKDLVHKNYTTICNNKMFYRSNEILPCSLQFNK